MHVSIQSCLAYLFDPLRSPTISRQHVCHASLVVGAYKQPNRQGCFQILKITIYGQTSLI